MSTPKTRLRQTAYARGFQARELGYALNVNPMRSSRSRMAWIAGWWAKDLELRNEVIRLRKLLFIVPGGGRSPLVRSG